MTLCSIENVRTNFKLQNKITFYFAELHANGSLTDFQYILQWLKLWSANEQHPAYCSVKEHE
jgi:hypothetical protein